MGRKYLEDIMPKEKIFGYHDEMEGRHTRWLKQEEIYGFNDIETWCLDVAFAQLIYERLMMYKEVGGSIVDLNYHTFKMDDKEYTELELIDMMLEHCKYVIQNDDLEEQLKHMDEVWKIMGVVHSALWW